MQTGHRYEQDISGMANVLVEKGHKCMIWSENSMSAFAAFRECQPDVFIGSTGLLTRAISKCIDQFKPKTALYVDSKEVVLPKNVNLLMAYDVIDAELGPDVLKAKLTPCINMHVSQNPKEDSLLKSEVLFTGNYNSPDRTLINRYVIPLAHDYKLKVFGPGNWPIPNALGRVSLDNMKNVVYNAGVYIYLTSNQNEFSWNPLQAIMYGVPVMTNNEALKKLNLPFIYDISDDISNILKNSNRESQAKAGKDLILNGYTNYDYTSNIFKGLGYEDFK